MRTPNKLIVGLMGAGVLAASYKAGVVKASESLTSSSVQGLTTDTGAAAAAAAAPATEPTTAASGNGATTTAPESTPSKTTAPVTTTPAQTTAPVTPTETTAPVATPEPVAPAAPTTATAATTTQSGDAIRYRFGTVQVSVTKAGSTITGVTMLVAGATGGRAAVFPTLVSWAKQANGSGFGNYSGATFTVQAFKQSLDTALAKF